MERSTMRTDIAIIGAGLTGLTLAYLLKDSPYDVKLIEARKRLGGRILTKGYEVNQPIELGATWFGNQHKQLKLLLKELSIENFDQEIGASAIYEAISTSPPYLAQLPENPHPSKRLVGGTEKIIHLLSQKLNPDHIILNQAVSDIIDSKESVLVRTSNYTIKSKIVVSTLPPNLLISTINFQPTLPSDISNLCRSTHTWMGESIKIALTYSKPFWRSEKLSGTIMSNVGPIGEMYDHSNYEESFFALKGFFSSIYFSISKEERLSMTINQLKKYFGSQAEEFLTYEEKIWRNDELTFAPYKEHILPHQNNGHPLFHKEYFNGKLIIGGTETSKSFPGYMEGAIASAQTIATKLRNI